MTEKSYKYVTIIIRRTLPNEMNLKECFAYIAGLEVELKKQDKSNGDEIVSITPTRFTNPR